MVRYVCINYFLFFSVTLDDCYPYILYRYLQKFIGVFMHDVLYVRPIFTKIFLDPSVVNFINIKFYEEPFSDSRLKDGKLPS